MPDASTAIRGAFFDLLDDPWKYPGREHEAARFVRDGLLVLEKGVIKDFGPFSEVSRRHPTVPVTHIRDRLILPGFIDGHIHFPQTRVLGAFGNQLLDWLQNWIFPEEIKYADRDYARAAAGKFFEACWPVGPQPVRHSPRAARFRPRSSSRKPAGGECGPSPG